jgi:hypothetical protein
MVLKVLQVIGIFITSWVGTASIMSGLNGNTVEAGQLVVMSVGIVFIFLRIIF